MLPRRALTDVETIDIARLECPDTIDIWWWPVGQAEADWPVLEIGLRADERERAAAIIQPDDRKVFIAGRYLQREVLGAYLDLEGQDLRFVSGPQGKPALGDLPVGQVLAFNLANTRGLAVLVVSRSVHMLGVDAEKSAEKVSLAEAGIFCCDSELQLLAGLRPAERNALGLAYWVLKESALKATGTGLLHSPAELEISVAPDKTIAIGGLPASGRGGAWWHELFSLAGDYSIAVSASGCDGQPRVRQQRFSPDWRMGGG